MGGYNGNYNAVPVGTATADQAPAGPIPSRLMVEAAFSQTSAQPLYTQGQKKQSFNTNIAATGVTAVAAAAGVGTLYELWLVTGTSVAGTAAIWAVQIRSGTTVLATIGQNASAASIHVVLDGLATPDNGDINLNCISIGAGVTVNMTIVFNTRPTAS